MEPQTFFADEGGHSHMTSNMKTRKLHECRLLAMVMAGGKGERLLPLTEHRAKSAVPFGGMCRLIDFVMSNLVNSGVREIFILTQYKAQSLLRHLQRGWTITHPMNGYMVMPVPSQMQSRDTWYLGTADSVYQNFDLIRRARPDLVLVFGSDHVYSMDVRQMVQFHLDTYAEVTVAAIPMPIKRCAEFGTVCVDSGWRIKRFEEKVSKPTPIPGRPDQALVSMGNYIFQTQVLMEELTRDAMDEESSHDFGRDILPKICGRRRLYAYDFRQNKIEGSEKPNDYWRDVGTIESYYLSNMDLNNPLSHLDLYNKNWPLRSVSYHDLPPRVIEDLSGRSGYVENSILGSSTIIHGGSVRNSVIGPNVRILSRAHVEDSVILGDVTVREGARVRRAIIDHGNIIEAGEKIGFDPVWDAGRYHKDCSGIVVVPHRNASR
jgi:glucose-1-phosphate adenylyltransferase